MPFCCGKRAAGICVILGPKKSSTYSSEYASGFFAPAASQRRMTRTDSSPVLKKSAGLSRNSHET